jgi:predicted transcriptional regulator
VAWWLNSESLPVVAVAWLAVVNVLLGIFNLLPGAPLDGGRLLRAFIWWRRGDQHRANEAATRGGRVLGMGLVGVGLIETLMGSYGGLWLALIGWFIMSSAASERYARTTAGLRQVHVRDIMTPTPAVVPDWWTVEQFLAGLDSGHARQMLFPLVDFEGRVDGAVTPHDIERLDSEERDTVRMRDVSRPVRLLLVHPDVLAADLAISLPTHGGAAVVVDEDSKPLGLVTGEDVVRAGHLLDIGWLPHDMPTDAASGDREKG